MPINTESNLFTAINKAAKKTSKTIGTIGTAEMTAFISSNATFSLLSTVFAGYPTIVRDVLKELAKYQIPIIGVPVAVITVLHLQKVRHMKDVYRFVESLMGAVGMTSFLVPLMMQLVTRIIQIIEKESRSSPVYISNGAAAVVIGGCTVIGLLQAMQTYFIDIKKEHPEQSVGCLNKATTNTGLKVTLGAVNAASAAHGAIMVTQKILRFNTESDAAYYSRFAITLVMGMAGAMILGGDESHSRKSTKLFLNGIKTAQLCSLAFAFVATFLTSPAAEAVFGEDVIDEQLYLWTAVIPILMSLLIAGNNCFPKEAIEEEEECLINDLDDLEASHAEENDSHDYPSEACNLRESSSNTIAINNDDYEHEHQEGIFSFSPA